MWFYIVDIVYWKIVYVYVVTNIELIPNEWMNFMIVVIITIKRGNEKRENVDGFIELEERIFSIWSDYNEQNVLGLSSNAGFWIVYLKIILL